MFLPLGLMLGIATTDIPMTGSALSFLLFSYLEKNFSWLRTTWFKWALMFWAWVMFISIFSVHSAGAFKQALVFIRYPLFAAALAHWLLRNSTIRRYFLWILTITMIFTSLDVWLQFITGHDILGHAAQMSYPSIDGKSTSMVSRLTGLSTKENPGKKLMMLAFPVVAYMMVYLRQKKIALWKSAGVLGCILVILVSVIITGERGASLLMLLGLGLLFLLIKHYRPLVLLITGLFLAACVLFLYHNSYLYSRYQRIVAVVQDISAPVTQKIEHVLTTPSVAQQVILPARLGQPKEQARPLDGPTAYRNLFTTAWHTFKDHPLTGVGIKQFNAVCQATPNYPGKYCSTSPQNMYLELLACTGMIGFILFMGMSFSWLRAIVRRADMTGKQTELFKNNPVMMAVGVALLIRFWPLICSSSLFFAWSGMSYWLMAGWLLGYVADRKSQLSNDEP
tara:strand:+ start:1358 stop:2710 length:1353 start_codon:yes stop_codon:yes gene_type:complete